MTGDLISQTEVAVMLGKSRKLIRRWTGAGVLPHFIDPESNRPVYSRLALKAWQAEQGRIAARVFERMAQEIVDTARGAA